jgi:hypothetical protein
MLRGKGTERCTWFMAGNLESLDRREDAEIAIKVVEATPNHAKHVALTTVRFPPPPLITNRDHFALISVAKSLAKTWPETGVVSFVSLGREGLRGETCCD